MDHHHRQGDKAGDTDHMASVKQSCAGAMSYSCRRPWTIKIPIILARMRGREIEMLRYSIHIYPTYLYKIHTYIYTTNTLCYMYKQPIEAARYRCTTPQLPLKNREGGVMLSLTRRVNRQPSIVAKRRQHSTTPQLIGPSILLLQRTLPIFDVIGDHFGRLVCREVAADSFDKVAFGVCVTSAGLSFATLR